MPATSFCASFPFADSRGIVSPSVPVRVFNEEMSSLIVDRLESALISGRITLPIAALFLDIVTPEESPPLAPAATPTTTAPGSEARVAVYAARAQRSETLYHPADADPLRHDLNGQLLKAERRGLLCIERDNGSGPQVLGWEDELIEEDDLGD